MANASKSKDVDDLSKVVDDVFESLSDLITGASGAPIKVTHWSVEPSGNDNYRVILEVRKS